MIGVYTILSKCDSKIYVGLTVDIDGRFAYHRCVEATSKAIIQKTKTGEFLAEYKSQNEAEKITNIPAKHINQMLRGKCKTSGGFVWEYKN